MVLIRSYPSDCDSVPSSSCTLLLQSHCMEASVTTAFGGVSDALWRCFLPETAGASLSVAMMLPPTSSILPKSSCMNVAVM